MLDLNRNLGKNIRKQTHSEERRKANVKGTVLV